MSARGPRNVFTIPASAGFAETLARGVVTRVGPSPLALAEVTIYLPTRRAARTFGDAFAKLLGGAALLPDFRPLGGIDEDEAFFSHAAATSPLPPAIKPLRRRLLLATLVRRWCQRRAENVSFAHAAALADGLTMFLDEAETQGVDLGRLDNLATGSLARHWSEVWEFLQLIRNEWPNILASEGMLDRIERQNAAILGVAEQIHTVGERFVIAAGSTGSIPATATLLAAIANLPNGAVVLPGLDRVLDETSWSLVSSEPAHPQFGLKQLIDKIGVDRSEVSDWVESSQSNEERESVLREVLRPAPTTDAWRRVAEGDTASIAGGVRGLSLLEASDPAEEASAIALMLRESLEHETRRAALITTDRGLARRVASELRRWHIDIDDSAGLPLSRTPPGTFLSLIAEAAEARFSPVSLLAMLQHPLAAPNGRRDETLRRSRELDRLLRGPRPERGLRGILERCADKPSLLIWFERVAELLRPFEELMEAGSAALGELIEEHIKIAEVMAGDIGERSPLWNSEAGEVARTLAGEFLKASENVPAIETHAYAALFRDITEGTPVRPQRRRNPRLAILGPLEARLQSFDLAILGGLNEGSWPRPVSADPWLSRPMREAIGLDSPERAIGLSAHDFATLASQPHVILTRSRKTEGTPTVPSRWIQRFQQFAKGLQLEGLLAPEIDWCGIARALQTAEGAPRPAPRPSPSPPVSARPRKLSITEIERWRRDPYAIYARHVLSLKELDELDAPVGPLERGDIVHRALETFITRFPRDLPETAVSELIAIADSLFQEERIPLAVTATWRPRFAHAARWFVSKERERRASLATTFVEVQGEMILSGPAGPFVVHGRADRIDALRGGGASIIDYKTGSIPTDKQVRELLAPQLPVEAAILTAGGFPAVGKIEPKELVYVRFSGGAEAGTWKPVKYAASEAAEHALALLARYVAAFDNPAKGYISRAIPFRSDLAGTYDHLARHGEWTGAVIEDVEE